MTVATFTNTDLTLGQFWHPVGLLTTLADGAPHQVWLLGEPWVVVALGGEVVAMRDRCPHRLVPLSKGSVVGDRLRCRYHGYEFDSTGACVAIPALGPDGAVPARACVERARVRVRFGLVWITVADAPTDNDLDEDPYLDPALDTFVAGPFTTPVGAAMVTDNFMDVTHLPFLHAATFGAYDTGRPELQARRDGLGVLQETPALIADEEVDGPVEVTYRYVVRGPFNAELCMTYPDGRSDYVWSFCQPETAGRTTWFMVHAYSGLGHDADAIDRAVRFQRTVGLEDLDILEAMPDPQLPIDLPAELHTKADRGCVLYRMVLRDIANGVAPDVADARPAAVVGR